MGIGHHERVLPNRQGMDDEENMTTVVILKYHEICLHEGVIEKIVL